MKIKYLLLSVFVFPLTNCTSNRKARMPVITPSGNNVQVVRKYDTSRCKFIAQVKGTALSSNASGEAVWNAAMNDIRNKAATMGSDTVLMKNYKHSTTNSVLKVTISGDAFKCNGISRKTIKQTKNTRQLKQRTETRKLYAIPPLKNPPNKKQLSPQPPSETDSNTQNTDEIHPPFGK